MEDNPEGIVGMMTMDILGNVKSVRKLKNKLMKVNWEACWKEFSPIC
jgi:hypothetical protein